MSRVATPASEAERQRARYKLLRVSAVAARLDVSAEHVRQLIADGDLQAMDVSRKASPTREYRIAEEWVAAFEAERITSVRKATA